MFRDFLNSKLTGAVLNAETGLKAMPKSQAHVSDGGFVEFGYGQVEPNHLSAQRTGQIYAQLPAASDIAILEQGQFVKYDYSNGGQGDGVGVVNFTGKGEWMLVYNEIKLYRDHPDGTKQWDCEFAMIADDYKARIYSPYDANQAEIEYHNGLHLNGNKGQNETITVDTNVVIDVEGQSVTIDNVRYPVSEDNKFTYNGQEYTLVDGQVKVPVVYTMDDVTLNTEDPYEANFTNDPWKKLGIYREKKMPAGTSMVPRVLKTNVGDIFTTNLVKATQLAVGDTLTPGVKGILEKTEKTDGMLWEVVKVYTLADGQKAVKIMRIQ